MSRIPKAYAADLAKVELLRFYLVDREFSDEFARLRQKHQAVVSCLLTEFGPQLSRKRTGYHFEDELQEALEKDAPGVTIAERLVARVDDLERVATHNNLEELLPNHFPSYCLEELVELVRDLRALATKFGLDYPWAVARLLKQAIIEATGASGLSKKHLSLIKLGTADMIARSFKCQPLVIEIPAAFVLWLSEAEILKGMRERLKTYKSELRKSGVPLDTQDALSRQIRWLFARKRHRLSPKQILDSDYLGDKVVEYKQIAAALRYWEKRLGGDIPRNL